MFNLVKYRYAFLLLSLAIIVPGFISLILFRLDVGIDFAGGGTMELLPQQTKTFTAAQMATALGPLKLGSLQIVPGNNAAINPKQNIWIRLNTQVDNNVLGTIANNIKGKYKDAGITFKTSNVPTTGGKFFTLMVIAGFDKTTIPQISDIQKLLTTLPKTTAPGSATTPAATPTPQPTAVVSATPGATATPATAGTIPVSVQDIQQGTTNDLYTIQTTTLLTAGDFDRIQGAVLQHGGPYMSLLQNAGVGPAVAQTTTEFAIAAVLASSCFILLYIWFSFRKLPKAYRYGVCAILAMIHDVLVVVGVFSILGKLFAIQIDALFITALLTVVGFSVHDTIVVFDRIRENLTRRTTESFEQIVNASLIQTMARSLNTSLTVLFTLLALTLFSGAGSVHNFTLALLIGIFSGTYSSIFNASMLLVMWDKGEIGFNHLGGGVEPVKKRGERDRELVSTRG